MTFTFTETETRESLMAEVESLNTKMNVALYEGNHGAYRAYAESLHEIEERVNELEAQP